MQGGQTQLKIDQPGLIKVGLPLVIIGFVAGLLWLLGFLGAILSALSWFVLAGAGWRYADVAIKDGKKLTLIDAAVNGAIIGGAVGLAYGIGSLIAGFTFTYTITELFYGAIAGAFASGAWTAYKSGMIKTS